MNHEEDRKRFEDQERNAFAQDSMDFLSVTAYKDMEMQLMNSYEQARKEAEFYK